MKLEKAPHMRELFLRWINGYFFVKICYNASGIE